QLSLFILPFVKSLLGRLDELIHFLNRLGSYRLYPLCLVLVIASLSYFQNRIIGAERQRLPSGHQCQQQKARDSLLTTGRPRGDAALSRCVTHCLSPFLSKGLVGLVTLSLDA